jgi:hypothetical protein
MTRPVAAGTLGRPQLGAPLALLAALLAAVTIAASLRELAIGKAEIAAAEDAVTRSAWTDAIGHARAAAEAYVPGGPWVERGLQRLDDIGRDAAIRGDRTVALLAYGAMRTSALATHSPVAPNTHWRSVAEDALARLAASDPEMAHSQEWARAARADLDDPSLPPLWVLGALSCSLLGILVGLAALGAAGRLSSGASVAKIGITLGFAAYAAILLLS